MQIQLLSPTQSDKWPPQSNHTIEWSSSGGKEPLNVTLEYSFSGNDSTWVTIATNLPSNGSLNWTTPSVNQNYYVRASAKDSSSPIQTTSTTAQVIGSQTAGSQLPILPVVAAVLATIIVLTAVVLLKRRKAGKTNN